MATLNVHKLGEATFRALRLQAAKHRVSMEEEARQILKRAVHCGQTIGDIALNLFGKKHGVSLKCSPHLPHNINPFE